MTEQPTTIEIDGSDDDHAAIEAAAAPLIDQGWQPVDSEPGEWLVLERNGQQITIQVA